MSGEADVARGVDGHGKAGCGGIAATDCVCDTIIALFDCSALHCHIGTCWGDINATEGVCGSIFALCGIVIREDGLI